MIEAGAVETRAYNPATHRRKLMDGQENPDAKNRNVHAHDAGFGARDGGLGPRGDRTAGRRGPRSETLRR